MWESLVVVLRLERNGERERESKRGGESKERECGILGCVRGNQSYEFWNCLVFQREGFCLPFVVCLLACNVMEVFFKWGLLLCYVLYVSFPFNLFIYLFYFNSNLE
jgi:hypothetical protein